MEIKYAVKGTFKRKKESSEEAAQLPHCQLGCHEHRGRVPPIHWPVTHILTTLFI